MPTLLEERQLSRSALRHRPIAPDAVNTQVSTPRASRIRQKHEPHTTGGPPSVQVSKAKSTWLVYLVLGMLVAVVLLWLGQMLWNWLGTVSDDIHYGRPRTTQVDHAVGHETGHTLSHFISNYTPPVKPNNKERVNNQESERAQTGERGTPAKIWRATEQRR